MARPTVRIKVQPRARVKVATIPKFPAQVIPGDGIDIASSGGVFTFSITPGFLSSPIITGGTIDNAPIGSTTPSSGAFTTLKVGTGTRVARFHVFDDTTIPGIFQTNTAAALLQLTNADTSWALGPNNGLGAHAFGIYNALSGLFPLTIDGAGITTLGSNSVSGGTLKLQNAAGAATLIGNGTFSITMPGATTTLVGRDTTDTLTNKTLTAPIINGGTATALTALAIRSTGAAFDLTFATAEVLVAGKTISFQVNNANRLINLGGDLQLTGAVTLPVIAQGDLWYGSAAATISALAKDTGTSRFLKNSGTSNNPAWVQPAVTDLAATTANRLFGTDGSGVSGLITLPAAGFTLSAGALALANDLSAVEGLSSTGMIVRSATDTWLARSMTGTANEITVANGDGVSGNPGFSLPAALTFTGKTVTGGTFSTISLGGTVSGGGNQINNVIIGTSTPLAGSFTTIAASTSVTVTSTSATALTVGRQGATSPALQIDASTATSATGLKVKSAAAAGGLALSVITSGTNENLTIDAAGSGTITLGGTSTGAITLTRATTLSAALTYGGVTLTNNVTGTGKMVLDTSPTLATPTLTTPVLGTPSSGTLTNCTGLPLSGLATQAAYTFVGNNSGSSAAPTAVDIAALTTKASPAAGDYVMLSDQAASGAWKKATVSSVASAGSVSSIAGNTGAFTLSNGITNSTNDIRLAAGSVVQTAYAEYTTNADLTTFIPGDDTIPQVTEGTQVLSQAITPKTTTNRVRVQVSGVGATVAADLLSIALFRNGGANAIASIGITSTGSIVPFDLVFEDVPGSTSAQTYTVRVGGGTQTARLNGTTGARYLGGTMRTTVALTEIVQ